MSLSNKNQKKRIANQKYKQSFTKMKRIVGNTTTYLSDLANAGNKLFKSNFIGVYNSDEIPRSIPKGSCFIVNVDGKNEPGSHWLGVCKERNNNTIWVYDSFGRNIHRLLPKIYGSGRIIKTTERDAEQNEMENNCGARSLAFIDVFMRFGPNVAKYI